MSRPQLLDLFCCAGGASKGYDIAGFEVVGVDIKPQPRYPFTFVQADAIETMDALLAGGQVAGYSLSDFDAIAASPPCQFATRARMVKIKKSTEPINFIPATRERLRASGLPYMIENVEQAREHLVNPVMLCGSMFGLQVERDGEIYQLRRHRLFETNVKQIWPPSACAHSGKVLGVYHSMKDHVKGRDSTTGEIVYGGQTVQTIEEGRELMGIDWMIWTELIESIPPAYTRWLGMEMRRAMRAGTPLREFDR